MSLLNSNLELRADVFAPTVNLGGQIVTPAGWMWIIGFALAGCEWAVAEADKPEFKKQIAEWMHKRHVDSAEQEIAALEQRIANIRANMPIRNAQ